MFIFFYFFFRVPFRYPLLMDQDDIGSNPSPQPDHTHLSHDDLTHSDMASLRQQHQRHAREKSEETTPTDSELLVSMAARLGVVEKEILLSKQELFEKVLINPLLSLSCKSLAA